jgi:hypothetical protein
MNWNLLNYFWYELALPSVKYKDRARNRSGSSFARLTDAFLGRVKLNADINSAGALLVSYENNVTYRETHSKKLIVPSPSKSIAITNFSTFSSDASLPNKEDQKRCKGWKPNNLRRSLSSDLSILPLPSVSISANNFLNSDIFSSDICESEW